MLKKSIFVSISFVFASAIFAQDEKNNNYYYEDPQLKIQLSPRTPDQMAAFYEARGFHANALQQLKETCFITVGIGNTGTDTIWLELKNWRFKAHNVPIMRFDRNYWKSQWQQVSLPSAQQSTFNWTQLPEVRDLQPGEPVGGNIVLPYLDEPFAIEAVFRMGKDKAVDNIVVTFNNVRCLKDVAAPTELIDPNAISGTGVIPKP